MHEVPEPGEEQVRLVAQRPLERPARTLLMRLELRADGDRLARRHRPDRGIEPVTPELGDRFGRELVEGPGIGLESRVRHLCLA